MPPATALLIAVALAAAAEGRRLAGGPGLPPPATLALAGLVAVGLAVQLADPSLLAAGGRDAGAIRSGAWWRLLTALFLQDGGLAGGAFNLALLFAIAPSAERLMGAPAMLALYLAGGIATGALALAWQPEGAGNSIAVLALGGALLGRGLRRPPAGGFPLAALAGLGAAAALLALRDIHGVATALGAAAGLATGRGGAGAGT